MYPIKVKETIQCVRKQFLGCVYAYRKQRFYYIYKKESKNVVNVSDIILEFSN